MDKNVCNLIDNLTKHNSRAFGYELSRSEILQILKLFEDVKELEQYRAIGTIEEFKALKGKSVSVEECLNILVMHCKLKEKNQASCLGCPVRKSYGTKQPQVCKLNMIERPSDLELNIDWR